MSDLLIENIRLVDPASDLDATGALLIQNGRIADWGANLGRPDGVATLDGEGAILLPGLVDMRASLGEPGFEYRETVASAARAASAGGITTIAALPDSRPAIDDPALVRLMRSRGEETGAVTILPYAALTKGCRGEELSEIGLLREAGAVAFTDGQRAIADARLMRLALSYARGFGARIVQHPEDPALAAGGAATEGEQATRLGLPSIPAAAEAILVARDIRLAELTGGLLHFAHVSTAEALELIRRAKERGLPISCDTAPYFDLNETAIGDFRTYAKLSPPLRAEADRLAVCAALADGTIDAIASDHQPRDADDKRLPFALASSGGAGLATLLPVTLARVHGGGLPLARALHLLTAGPATLLDADSGRFRRGAPADLCLFDLERAWQIESGNLPGKAQNTPFDGRAVEGRVIGTWSGGRRVFFGAMILAAASLLGFLLGSIPFGLLLTRAAGLGDIRKTGSGSIGATNVLRTGRKDVAAATLLLDAGKGAVAAFIMAAWGGPDAAMLAGVAAVLGHCFSPWIGFKGGKGIATGAGVLLAWSWQAGLLCLAVWLAAAVLSKRSSVAALFALVAAPLLLWAFVDGRTALAGLLVSAVCVARHHANIARLLAGTEPRIGQKVNIVDRLRLIRTEGVGPITYRRLLDRYSTPAEALDALPALARAGGRPSIRIPTTADVNRELDQVTAAGARLLFVGDPDYPALLASTDGAPPAIAVKGDPAVLNRRAVALVGARNASTNGKHMADLLAYDLADSGLVVVSGMARGIDTAAHTGALRAGQTIAAIAGGIDNAYPAENADLQRRVAEHGAVVAEAPFGTAPQARHFPRRNRVIAGLSLAVIVVEAAPRSGSLITARFAAEMGRDLFAVPGSPLDARCRGSNDLIRTGAHLVESASDVIAFLPELRTATRTGVAEPPEPFTPLPADLSQIRRTLLENLGHDPTAIDELIRQNGLPSAIVHAALLELELGGQVSILPNNQACLISL